MFVNDFAFKKNNSKLLIFKISNDIEFTLSMFDREVFDFDESISLNVDLIDDDSIDKWSISLFWIINE